MKLVLAEKPSVAQSIAKVLGANKREDGFLIGNGYIVSWCVGHLVELAQPVRYDERYAKWKYADLPIFLLTGSMRYSSGGILYWSDGKVFGEARDLRRGVCISQNTKRL